jgi:hypothetical protein
MGVKIEELKNIKGGGKTRRETKNWRRCRDGELGRDGVGTGNHED